MKLDYSIAEVAPYINWIYFDHAWGMSGKPEAERLSLRREASECLLRVTGRYKTHGVFELYDAYSEDDDFVLKEKDTVRRIPLLRQQQAGSQFLCLADFVSGKCASQKSKIGVFATTVDAGMETDFDNDPYEKMMMQLLADRLAEATAERMHEQVRKHYWGYAEDEQLSIGEMLSERWQGIRPAVGYPSLPDTSLNFLIDQLIGLSKIGIRLTGSGAMKPHASVSGFMLSHPEARYFSIGKIGEDQLRDYARRRGMSISDTRRFLQANL